MKGDNVLDDKLAKCPFFRRHKPMEICCEGVLPDTLDVIRFENSKERERQYTVFCCWQFEKCERHTAIRARYDDN